MNEHQGNEIEFGLITVLDRPNGSGDKGEQTMNHYSQKHGKCSQGIEIMISCFIQFKQIQPARFPR